MWALDVFETATFTHGDLCLCHRSRRPMVLCTASRDEEPTAEYFLTCLWKQPRNPEVDTLQSNLVLAQMLSLHCFVVLDGPAQNLSPLSNGMSDVGLFEMQVT